MTAKRAAKKRKRKLPSLTPARVRHLAIEFADMTAADAHLGRRWDLPAAIQKNVELDEAWRAGRFLRNLRRLAGSAATLAETAHALNLTVDDLTERINNHPEIASIWNEARLEAAVRIKEQWTVKAGEGNVRAMAQVEAALRDEIAHAALDIHNVPTEKMAEITGVTVMTLNRWLRHEGMPRNAGEPTYDLPLVWAWFERFVQKRTTGGPPESPLQAQKAREKKLQVDKLQGHLWDRQDVVDSLIVRAQALATALSPERAAELSHAQAGQPGPEIARALEAYFLDVRRVACELPEKLILPPPARDLYERLMQTLNEETE